MVTEGVVTCDVGEIGDVEDVVPQLVMENVNMSSTASVMSSFLMFFLLFELLCNNHHSLSYRYIKDENDKNFSKVEQYCQSFGNRI